MRWLAYIVPLLLLGCKTLPTGGFVIGGPTAPEPQPEGFATVHWIAYSGGFLMVIAGALLFWLLQQPKSGAGLAATGLCTIALALASAFYGRELALASFILLGAGIVGALGYLLWYAWHKRVAFTEVVKEGNGQIEAMKLSPQTRRQVEIVKAKAATIK